MPKKNISLNKKLLVTASLFAMIALLASFQTVLAHEHITVGDYAIEIGWANIDGHQTVGAFPFAVGDTNISMKPDGWSSRRWSPTWMHSLAR